MRWTMESNDSSGVGGPGGPGRWRRGVVRRGGDAWRRLVVRLLRELELAVVASFAGAYLAFWRQRRVLLLALEPEEQHEQ